MVATRMLLHRLQVVVVLCALGPAAHAQTAAAISRGHDIAQQACAGCHGIDGGGGGTIIQGTAVPSFGAIADRPNMTAERLQALIMTPRHPMPAIPLGFAETNDLVAYIRSLR
jgi:mono/diheme cytochrome c family protein